MSTISETGHVHMFPPSRVVVTLFDHYVQAHSASLRVLVKLLLAVYAVVASQLTSAELGDTRESHLNRMLAIWNPVRVAVCARNVHNSSMLCFRQTVKILGRSWLQWSAPEFVAIKLRHPVVAHQPLLTTDFPSELADALLL